MMDRRHKWAAVAAVGALSVLVGVVGAVADDGDDDVRQNAFTVALWGDMPYSAAEISKLPALIADINAAKVAFSVFDGDIKSGSSLCTDSVFTAAIQRFGTFRSPMVYVPGDNEWTDCHRINNGGYNALSRLSFLRETMFAEEQSFGEKTLLLEHQPAATTTRSAPTASQPRACAPSSTATPTTSNTRPATRPTSPGCTTPSRWRSPAGCAG